ncbi:hypothetical protein TB2_028342 [Malus domestica]
MRRPSWRRVWSRAGKLKFQQVEEEVRSVDCRQRVVANDSVILGEVKGKGDWRWWSVASGLWRVWVAIALVCCGFVGEAMNEREELVLTSETVDVLTEEVISSSTIFTHIHVS